MQKNRVYNIKEAIERIQSYCALQDRCQWDVERKLNEWGLMQSTIEMIMLDLISEQFINELRFSESFCRGKFRIKNWGKRKIINELKRKKISIICINSGLQEIDDNDYNQVLDKLFHQKKATIKDKNHFTQKTKIASFLIQRGFESNLVWDKIRELSDK